jgi:cell division protein FtsZ
MKKNFPQQNPVTKIPNTSNPIQNGLGHANILIIGCGGAGNNTIDRMMKIGIRGAQCIAINTDQQHLNNVQAHVKLLIGRNLTRGLGAGGSPEIGKAAAEESSQEINEIVQNGDLVFITAGMGGGTGTGSAPIVAELAKKNGAIVVGVITLPFKAEMGRMQKAKEGIKTLKNHLDTLVIIDNNRLLEIAADLPIVEAFSLADEVLATMVKGITETISLPSLINLDYADIRTILTSGGMAIVGIGEGTDPHKRVEEAIEDALKSPLLEFDISGAKGALIHITGGNDLTLIETTKVANIITEKMDPNANVIWGARVDPNLVGVIRVMLLITGVKSPQVFGNSKGFINKPLNTSSNNRPSLADEFFKVKEIKSINSENLTLY